MSYFFPWTTEGFRELQAKISFAILWILRNKKRSQFIGGYRLSKHLYFDGFLKFYALFAGVLRKNIDLFRLVGKKQGEGIFRGMQEDHTGQIVGVFIDWQGEQRRYTLGEGKVHHMVANGLKRLVIEGDFVFF